MHLLIPLLLWSGLAGPVRSEVPVPRSRVGVPFVRTLEEAARSGEITAQELLRYRGWAVTAPGRLPEPWRTIRNASPVPAWAGTAVLVENFQWSRRLGLRDDTQFPTVVQYLDSTDYPIRVAYAQEADLPLAQAVLAAAEEAWRLEVDTWGFLAPPLVTSEGRYRIYVDDSGMGGGGYMAPVDFHWDTPWDDCYSYVVIDRLNSPFDAGPVVAHELSHATQGAMDCLETITFWENTSTFVMAEVGAGGRGWQDAFLAYFQDYPEESLSGGGYEDEELAYFWYGGFLWPHFLGGLYGGEEHPAVLVRRVWEGAMQESGGYENTVSYMHAIDDVLAARAGSSLDEAFSHFTVSRFLLGPHWQAPAADMPHAGEYTSVPPIEADLAVDLPTQFTPTPEVRPEPYAVNYLKLSVPAGFSREVTVRLTTPDTADWALILFSTKSAEVLRAPATSGVAELRYTPGEERDRMLAVARLGTPGFHSDEVMEGAGYTIEAGPTFPAPEIEAVTPAEVVAGLTTELTITGEHFVEGATVVFSPYFFDADAVTFVDANTLRVTVTPGADTGLNWMSVTVTNPDTGADTLLDAFYIDPPPKKKTSGCATSPGDGSSAGALWLLLALMALLRRRN
jgi:MYXO-CTERM domain-containing protein